MKRSFFKHLLFVAISTIGLTAFASAQTTQSSPAPIKWIALVRGTGALDANGNVIYKQFSQCQYRLVTTVGFNTNPTIGNKSQMYFSTAQENLGAFDIVSDQLYTKPLSAKELHLLYLASAVNADNYSMLLTKLNLTLRMSMVRAYDNNSTNNALTPPQYVIDYYDPVIKSNMFMTLNPTRLTTERLCF